jgi:hypothetical protein
VYDTPLLKEVSLIFVNEECNFFSRGGRVLNVVEFYEATMP